MVRDQISDVTPPCSPPIPLRKSAHAKSAVKLKISPEKTVCFNTIAQNIDCVYTLKSPRRGGSNVYPQSKFKFKFKFKYFIVSPQ